MTFLLAPLLLAATAVVQALGRHEYHQDGMTVVGQLIFPIFFAALAAFLARRGEPGVFGAAHRLLAVAGAVLLVLSVVGRSGTVPELYPSAWVYYAAFALLAVEAGLRIAGTPKRSREDVPADASVKR